MGKTRAELKAEKDYREKVAAIVYNYPQYSIQDIMGTPENNFADGLPLGDINLLYNYAIKQHNRKLLDQLNVAVGATSKKAFRIVKKGLEKAIKESDKGI